MNPSYQNAELTLRDLQAPDYERWMVATKGSFFDSLEKSAFSDLVCPRRFRSALEIGCGTGRITETVAPHVGTLAALDFSEASISVVRAKRIGNVTAQCANACEGLPFSSCSFPLILSCQVLHHLKEDDLLTVLKECRRVLEPGGKLAFSAYNLDYFRQAGAEETSENGLYSKRFSKSYVRYLAATSGFEVGEVRYYKAVPSRVAGLAPRPGPLLRLDKRICAFPGIGSRLAGYTLPVFQRA